MRKNEELDKHQLHQEMCKLGPWTFPGQLFFRHSRQLCENLNSLQSSVPSDMDHGLHKLGAHNEQSTGRPRAVVSHQRATPAPAGRSHKIGRMATATNPLNSVHDSNRSASDTQSIPRAVTDSLAWLG